MSSWDLGAIDEYVEKNTLDNEDWLNSEENRKEALLNVSKRTLDRKFPDIEEIPDEAYYLFAVALAVAYNDTMVNWQRGLASFSIRGMSFTFKDWARSGLDTLIPEEVYEMVGKPRKQIKWTVM